MEHLRHLHVSTSSLAARIIIGPRHIFIVNKSQPLPFRISAMYRYVGRPGTASNSFTAVISLVVCNSGGPSANPEKLPSRVWFASSCWQLVAEPEFCLQPIQCKCTHWLYTLSQYYTSTHIDYSFPGGVVLPVLNRYWLLWVYKMAHFDSLWVTGGGIPLHQGSVTRWLNIKLLAPVGLPYSLRNPVSYYNTTYRGFCDLRYIGDAYWVEL